MISNAPGIPALGLAYKPGPKRGMNDRVFFTSEGEQLPEGADFRAMDTGDRTARVSSLD